MRSLRLPIFPARPTRQRWLVALTTLLLVASKEVTAAEALHRFEFSEPHMATLWTIVCYTPERSKAETAVKAAFERVDLLERVMTDYDPESELLRLCRLPATVSHSVSSELFEVLRASEQASRLTEGAFDITSGRLVQVWRRARRQREYPDPSRLAEAQAVLGWTNVVLDKRHRTALLRLPEMRLDLGGIGKGYAADAALKVLREHGLRRSLVAASGDLAIGDAPPAERGWRVRVGEPTGKTNVIGELLLLHNVGVSTSGDTEQFVELGGVRYSHIVNPWTGLGLTNRIQVTVIADSATRSDGLDTAFCVLGLERSLKIVNRDRHLSLLALIPAGEGYTTVKSGRFPPSYSEK